MAAQRRRRRSSQRESTATPVVVRSAKNPGVAAALSFVLCGLGQIYNGQLFKGILLAVLFVGSLLLIAAGIGALTAPILWVVGIVDAYRTAQTIDRPPSPTRPAKAEDRDERYEF